MAKRLVLYLTAGAARLYRCRRGRLEVLAELPASEEGAVALRPALRTHEGALVALVADVAGEDFHEDRIPYLRGSDRQAVIARRLAQRYRDARLAVALSLGTLQEERRNERLLLASFSSPQQFSPWLAAIAQSPARLAGVYSTALLVPRLARGLGLRAPAAILAAPTSAGLRQVFLTEGRLRFSRLERFTGLHGEAAAAFVRAETERLLQYLQTLRVVARDAPPLQVVVLAPGAELAAWERALRADARFDYRVLALEKAQRRLGLRSAPTEADAFFAYSAARHPPSEQFAQTEDRRPYILWRARRALVAGGAAALGACALWAGALWLELLELRGQIATQGREAAAARQRYERITADFPVTYTTTENLRAVVHTFQGIAARTASPEPALRHLAQALDRFPSIQLDSVAWRIEAKGGSETAKPASTPSPVEPSAGRGPPTQQMVEIGGRVEGLQRSDYRAITLEVQRFAKALEQSEGWRVVSTKLPFDVTPDATLSGDIGTEAARGETPRFALVLARTLP